MKRFKLLFLTTTLIFSNFTFVAEGGICASKQSKAKEQNEIRVIARRLGYANQAKEKNERLMLRVIARRLGYAPLAKRLLAACLLGPRQEVQQRDDAAGEITVSVEAVGSGIIIIRALQVDPDDTVGSLRKAILSRSSSSQSLLEIKLFLGHGGAELSDNNVTLRDAGVLDRSTIVVVHITLELYLAQQRIVMAKLYQLLPDGVSKDGAIAKFNDHPTNPSIWLGVRKVSPEGFLLDLNLSYNQLKGPIPSELGLLTKLKILSLYDNQLTGEIPSELGRLTKLQELELSSNQLTGAIPRELGQLTELQGLYLYTNQLTGPIPVELGQLTQLQTLSLSENQLTGEIPGELGQLTELKTLSLSKNQLTGETPPELIRRGVRVFR